MLEEIDVDMYVRFSDTDEDGKYSYTGKVLEVDIINKLVYLEVQPPYGEVAVELDLSKFTKSRKPTNYGVTAMTDKTEVTTNEAADTEAKTTKATKPAAKKTTKTTTAKPKADKPTADSKPKEPSKRERVMKLLSQKTNAKLTRKEQIALVVEQIGMTDAGAATYVSTARKELGQSTPRQASGS